MNLMFDINPFFTEDYLIGLFNKKIKKSKSKGIDKISLIDFETNLDNNIKTISRKVLNGSYKFSPYLELLKLKGRNKSPRVISIPTIRDKVVLLALKEILHSIFHKDVNRHQPNSYIKKISSYLSSNPNEKFYLKLDIEKFYDKIDREILIQKLTEHDVPNNILELLKRAIDNITIPLNCKKNTYTTFQTNAGIPQGLAISNILAQIYLVDFDNKISKRKYFYKRYVDDILLINESKFSNYRINNFIKEVNYLGLNINNEKTECDSLNNKPFMFLSYKISNSKISIADKNIEFFIRRIAAKFTWFKEGIKNKNKRPEWLKDDDERFKEVFLEELNETITGMISKEKNYGWLFYYSEINDLQLLFRLDKIISKLFSTLEIFDNKAPVNLKKLSRTLYCIKHNSNKNYISDYDKINTFKKKRDFLAYRGIISSMKHYEEEYIELMFEKHLNKQISKAQKDQGYKYIN